MGVKGRGSSASAASGPEGGWLDYNSIHDLELEAESRFGTSFNLFGMTPENAQIFLDEYEQFVHDYPEVLLSVRPGSNALMSTGNGYLSYNAIHLTKGISELNERIRLNQILAEQTFREAVRHEMYHGLHQSMTPRQQAKMHEFLQRTYADAIRYEDMYNKPLFSTYAMKPGVSISFTELHSELSVMSSRGLNNKYARELRSLHKEFFK